MDRDENELASRLRDRFDGTLDEPLPAHLVDAGNRLATALAARAQPPVRRAWSPRQYGPWLAVAASLVVGILLGHQFLLTGSGGGPLTIEPSGRIIATGTLAQALDAQLAADPATGGAPRTGISFVAKNGEYCRTFSAGPGGAAMSGLACRDEKSWRLQLVESRASTTAGEPAFRQAASALSPSLLQAAQALMRDEPLDAAGEARARAGGWLPLRLP